MPTNTWTGTLHGVEALSVEVEVDLLSRLPGICIVGLPDNAIRESGERIRSAIQSAGYEFPRKRVIVNLAPADHKKDGTALDLPIALAILVASGQLVPRRLNDLLIAGELSLSGGLRRISGGLAFAKLAKDQKKDLVLPSVSAEQASLLPEVNVFGFDTLKEVVTFLEKDEHKPIVREFKPCEYRAAVDLSDIRGQETAKRAIEIAAAGGHHLLLLGPPGCGKTMLARSFSGILPKLKFDEALEVTRIHNVAARQQDPDSVAHERPFRAPHHTTSIAGMVGDRRLRPGEICLAHRGVLFLDEATEFSRSTLETLRQPLESGELRLTRAIGTAVYPAKFNLILAANPCPCGNFASRLICQCTPNSRKRYLAKLSGPILDRIDLHVQLDLPTPSELFSAESTPTSATVRERVQNAQEFARSRVYGSPKGISPNPISSLDREAKELLVMSADALQFSARAVRRVTNVARTIADLDLHDTIRKPHIAEALAYRVRGVA